MNTETNIYCKYCSKLLVPFIVDWFECTQCHGKVHSYCLKRLSTPGGIYGDTFFDFTCTDCSMSDLEVLQRDKMPWFQVVVLVMYHLHNKSGGIAKSGYFHWRSHIITFIEKNWDFLFNKNFKKRKNWTGTIAGILSTYSPYFFFSGMKEVGESGWWRLTFSKLSPAIIVSLNAEIVKEKQKKTFTDELHFVKQQLKKYISESKNFYTDTVVPNHRDNMCEKKLNLMRKTEKSEVNKDYIVPTLSNPNFGLTNDSSDSLSSYLAKEFSFPNEEPSTGVNLFSNNKSSDFQLFWQKHKSAKPKKTKKRLTALSAEEEKLLAKYLTKYDNAHCKRLKRKLLVRDLQRKAHLKPFNIETLLKPTAEVKQSPSKNKITCYGVGKKISKDISVTLRMIADDPILMSSERLSPYTSRVLKPYIRRDEEMLPPWLKLMLELQHCVSKEQVSRATLDFCYVTPHCIPVINSLCEHFFWPGIDLTEALQYPDFTCVVLYRKLIVGFAFMIPDAKHNEAYISFIFTLPGWRRCGIATFMVYHLIQTCMGKDITLHVSIDNPAIFLYQKFGFKVEEVVLNFYENYLRDDDIQSKHAFFLRLER